MGMKLEDLKPNASVKGIRPDSLVTVVNTRWFGSEALELTYKEASGRVANELLYRHDEPRLEVVEHGRPWSFDADGHLFRLVSEAHRIHLAHLFDPLLAVHTSVVEPLPHQITAVYEAMLPRQPLRFLLADDPGAGKTIMAGLLIKELMVRGDLLRCMVVCPGSLAEQWQDELWRRFQLPFDILTNDKLEAARTGNWFAENNLIICRLDKLARNDDVRQKLHGVENGWDLIVCDEAHKLSATYFGGEIKYTKRYRLAADDLSPLTRHLLLMTATPHNGKDEDFQLFLALLDGDRFEGKARDGARQVDVSDMMRRMIKESLVKFDGKPLFPPRHAHTVKYKLSEMEAKLYKEVTQYVREEFNRADALQNDKRAGTVGFALTILQRRLASSPEAIYQSLKRRKERLEKRLRELEIMQRGAAIQNDPKGARELDEEDLKDLEEAPDSELEATEEEILDQATAAGTIQELRAEIAKLGSLETLAATVRRSGEDRKWKELANLLTDEIFSPNASFSSANSDALDSDKEAVFRKPASPSRRKLVVFTEHKDTLTYLIDRIRTVLGNPDKVVTIHGGIGRQERLKVQEAFMYSPEVQVLVATDAAGEGINLQRAHLMVNYDLPWNPSRLEQRFGRIHRIGQTEICHLWNMVAAETREGDVYIALLTKLENIRQAMGGQVYDVLGKLQFDGKPLRELLIEAIRYGEDPKVKERLDNMISTSIDKEHLQNLMEEKALTRTVMDTSKVEKVREGMERAEARRLQPHYIQSFFVEALKLLGGSMHQQERNRFRITQVPSNIRNRDRIIGAGAPLLPSYERVTFDKSLITLEGQPNAAFICPGHPLLDSTIDIILEKDRDLLRRGAVLVDERDTGRNPRVLFYLEHAVQDASRTKAGERRTISKQMLYVEISADGSTRHLHYAPYLDYRPLKPGEMDIDQLLARPEAAWITRDLEDQAMAHAAIHVVPEHLKEVKQSRLEWIDKTKAAVKERLTREINYWDHRAAILKEAENKGEPNARLNSQEARKRADDLQGRLQKRMEQLDQEAQISALPPVVMGGMVVVPAGLLASAGAAPEVAEPTQPEETQASAAMARAIVMEVERSLGHEPEDKETEKLGYDIESRDKARGRLRFIEVKGRVSGAQTITVTKNEILYSLNKPEDFILAIVEFFPGGQHKVHYIRQPFAKEPDFGVTSVNYNFAELLAKAEAPN